MSDVLDKYSVQNFLSRDNSYPRTWMRKLTKDEDAYNRLMRHKLHGKTWREISDILCIAQEVLNETKP